MTGPPTMSPIINTPRLPVDDKKRQREMRIMENRQLNRQPAAATGSRHVSGESVGRVHTISNEGKLLTVFS